MVDKIGAELAMSIDPEIRKTGPAKFAVIGMTAKLAKGMQNYRIPKFEFDFGREVVVRDKEGNRVEEFHADLSKGLMELLSVGVRIRVKSAIAGAANRKEDPIPFETGLGSLDGAVLTLDYPRELGLVTKVKAKADPEKKERDKARVRESLTVDEILEELKKRGVSGAQLEEMLK